MAPNDYDVIGKDWEVIGPIVRAPQMAQRAKTWMWPLATRRYGEGSVLARLVAVLVGLAFRHRTVPGLINAD